MCRLRDRCRTAIPKIRKVTPTKSVESKCCPVSGNAVLLNAGIVVCVSADVDVSVFDGEVGSISAGGCSIGVH